MSSSGDSALAALKASAGERHARDSTNNPQIGPEKVPLNSAAAKTDSALGHYVAALATDQDAKVPDPQGAAVQSVQGQSIPLDEEPGLAEDIAAKAQQAQNPAAADHFSQAAEGLRAAHAQDKEWLARHPDMDQTKRI